MRASTVLPGRAGITANVNRSPQPKSEEIMKSKALVFLSTLIMAVGLIAQNATQTTPAPAGDSGKTCASCNHGQAGAKMACCGKDGDCCKDGTCCQGKDGKQCPMMSKDKDGKVTCCAGGKCPMMAKGKAKSCCGGKTCERPQTGA
jgi:hypothetical protein